MRKKPNGPCGAVDPAHSGGHAAQNALHGLVRAGLLCALCAALRCSHTIPYRSFEELEQRDMTRVLKNERSYIGLLEDLDRHFHQHRTRLFAYDTLYFTNRIEWIGHTVRPIDGAGGELFIRTEWKRLCELPAVSTGMASWILSLHQRGVCVLGCRRLSAAFMSLVTIPDILFFAETDRELLWATSITSRRIWLSDGSSETVNPPPSRIRQWLAVFPAGESCCAPDGGFAAGDGLRSRGIYWYPGILKQHAAARGDTPDGEPFPGIRHDGSCLPVRK